MSIHTGCCLEQKDFEGGQPEDQSLRIYAHCSKDGKGGVALLALNTDTAHEQMLMLPLPAERFTLTASDLTSTKILLNGAELIAKSDGSARTPRVTHHSSGNSDYGRCSLPRTIGGPPH